MHCKNCKDPLCSYRREGEEAECSWPGQIKTLYIEGETEVQIALSPKALWISETAVKIFTSISCDYVTSGIGGQKHETRQTYAARIAKEMAEVIFSDEKS